ncbi:MAG TPA: hypothetical protein ENI23_10375 [bacterium]|nr:hypothetical protein [bacterium]
MRRASPRKIRPTSTRDRNLDIVHKSETIESSATLTEDQDTIFTMTTSSKKGVPILVQEDISLFNSSISEANLIPNGSNIDFSNYQVIGPWREYADGDGKNIVSKIYVRNVDVSTSTTDLNRGIVNSNNDGSWIGVWDFTSDGISVGGGTAALGEFYMAVRYENITIPQGEQINSATLTFTASGGFAETVLTKIYGIDEDTTGNFSNNPGVDGENRPVTSANVDWDRTGITEGQTYTTPDLSAIVQEIVDRPGWSSGNSMGFIIYDDGSSVEDYFIYDSEESPGDDTDAELDINYGTDHTAVTLDLIFRGQTRYITPRRDVTIT